MWKYLFTAVGIVAISGQLFAGHLRLPTQPKSEETALALSLGTTAAAGIVGCFLIGDNMTGSDVAAVALLVYPGLALGPGAGHLYAGNKTRFWNGTLVRAAVLPLIAYGAASSAFSSSYPYSNDGTLCRSAGKWGLCLIAAGLYLLSAMNDIGDLDTSVREFNQSHGFADIQIHPSFRVSADQFYLLLAVDF
jgi:hypothetical protein